MIKKTSAYWIVVFVAVALIMLTPVLNLGDFPWILGLSLILILLGLTVVKPGGFFTVTLPFYGAVHAFALSTYLPIIFISKYEWVLVGAIIGGLAGHLLDRRGITDPLDRFIVLMAVASLLLPFPTAIFLETHYPVFPGGARTTPLAVLPTIIILVLMAKAKR